MIATITKDVPKAAVGAITPMFNKLLSRPLPSHKLQSLPSLQASNYDWALHPGGAAILQGAKHALRLTDDHLRASLDVYKHFGNSSSPTVLVVLDKLRRMGEGRDDVVATSFGPGLAIEMCTMRRCRQDLESQPSVTGQLSNLYKLWPSLHSRMIRRVARKSVAMMKV
jgi:predicted naringenin-chalcone synthase